MVSFSGDPPETSIAMGESGPLETASKTSVVMSVPAGDASIGAPSWPRAR